MSSLQLIEKPSNTGVACYVPPAVVSWPSPATVPSGQLEAALQALADVRTLDDWAARNPDDVLAPRYRGADAPADKRWEIYTGADWEFFATPDEARAKAAAWVREESKP